jgi:hypothetical protein
MEIIDDYYTRTEEIGPLPLPHEREQVIYLLWHQSRESCERGHREIGLGVMRHPCHRVYLHAKACFYTPEIVVTFATNPQLTSDPDQEIGYVLESEACGRTRHEIGNIQAWYYEKERILMLWEVCLYSHYCEPDPTGDFVLLVLWETFERELLRELPDTEAILTPGWEPKYEPQQWRAFLTEQGYAPHRENTYRKVVKSQ